MIPIVDGSYIWASMSCTISLVAYSYSTSDSMDMRSSFCVLQSMSSIVVVVCVFWWIISSKVIATLNIETSVNKILVS